MERDLKDDLMKRIDSEYAQLWETISELPKREFTSRYEQLAAVLKVGKHAESIKKLLDAYHEL